MKVLYLGSKKIGYECLQLLLQLQCDKKVTIAGVLTNDNAAFASDIIDLSSRENILIYKHIDEIINVKDIDLLISVQYHQILKPEHISVAKLAINYHMAPLPDYRGCNQFSFALYDEAEEFGTTVHRLEAGIDSGAIIDEIRFPIQKGWDVEDLYNETYVNTIVLFKRSIANIISGNISFKPQAEFLSKRTSKIIYRKDISKLKEISDLDTIPQIARKVRATCMPGFEPPYFVYNKKKYYVITEKALKK